MSNIDDFLEHHGVKGMKWGQRKARGSGKAPKRQSTEAKERDKVRAKRREHGVDALTNREIANHNRRVNLEKSYKTLDPTAIAKGAALVGAGLALGKLGNDAIKFGKSPAGQAIAKSLGKKAVKVAEKQGTVTILQTGKSFL